MRTKRVALRYVLIAAVAGMIHVPNLQERVMGPQPDPPNVLEEKAPDESGAQGRQRLAYR